MPKRKRKKINYASALPDIEHKHRMRLFKIYFSLSTDLYGCVLWNKHKDRKGYGQVSLGGKASWAHRIYYALFVGPIPEGQTIHHKCSNPGCVNPEHLEVATIAENTAEGNRRRATADDIPF